MGEPQPDPRCVEAARYLQLYADGEIVGAEREEVERHLAGCPGCARVTRQQSAFKAALKAAAPRPALPDGLRLRISAALNGEPARGAEPRWRVWGRKLAPAAAAAAVLLALIGTTHRFSPIASDAIWNHRSELPMDVTGGAAEVRSYLGPRLDFAVHVPDMPSATLVGARLTQIRDRRAAYLAYNVNGSRVSVLLFDPADLRLDARRRRQAFGQDVYLDDQRGYHVALVRSGGLGYAFASDLDEDRIFQLVSSTVTPRR